MSSIPVLKYSSRVKSILKEIEGVKSQYNITQAELSFLERTQGHTWGSEKQLKWLADIERKVFGFSHYEDTVTANPNRNLTFVERL